MTDVAPAELAAEACAHFILDADDLDGFLRSLGGGNVAWAIEEVLDSDEDGEHLLARSPDEGWTISIGWGDVVTEIDVTLTPTAATAGAAKESAVADEVLRRVSIAVVADCLAHIVGTAASLTLVHDPDWQRHRHPLAHLFQRYARLDGHQGVSDVPEQQ